MIRDYKIEQYTCSFKVPTKDRRPNTIIAVCIHRLVMINIERSETAQKSALEI